MLLKDIYITAFLQSTERRIEVELLFVDASFVKKASKLKSLSPGKGDDSRKT